MSGWPASTRSTAAATGRWTRAAATASGRRRTSRPSRTRWTSICSRRSRPSAGRTSAARPISAAAAGGAARRWRAAAWRRARGGAAVDGLALTPEMRAAARARGVHRRLAVADVADSGLRGGAYDLVVSCLVDEHLADVAALYREAWRLARPGGQLVLVGFHPHFIMASGMPTHFASASGEPV